MSELSDRIPDWNRRFRRPSRPARLGHVHVLHRSLPCLSSTATLPTPHYQTSLRSCMQVPAVSIWVVNAFLLAVAICVVPLSSLVDIIGYKRVYQIGLGLFTMASVGCSLPPFAEHLRCSPNFPRCRSGLHLEYLPPAIMRYTYPRAVFWVEESAWVEWLCSAWAAAGPSVASGILAIASWHWLFAINIPFGLLSLSLFRAVSRARQGNAPSV